MEKIVAIIDKSEVFISLERDRALKKWGEDDDTTITSLSQAGVQTLFGPSGVSYIAVNDVQSVKNLVAQLESAVKTKEIDNIVKCGLIISSTVARTSTKKLENIVSKLGGELKMTKENSKDKANIAQKLLDSTNLSRDVKSFLVDYAGDDFGKIVPLLHNLDSASPAAQKKLTVDAAIARLPQDPGGVPPWEVEKPLMRGNVGETVAVFRRAITNSHPILVVSVLKGKFRSAYLCAQISELSDNPTQKDYATATGMAAGSYPLKLAMESGRKIGVVRLKEIVLMLQKLERDIKGESALDATVLTEVTLIKIARMVK